MPDQWPLVGREEERAQIRALLDQRRSIVLAGSAGVGKTRLATDGLEAATRQGVATSRVAATHAAAAIPLGAFAPILPDRIARTDQVEMLRQVASAIAQRGGDAPFVLLVDDAHLLDETSAALTYQLATGDAVQVLATVRSGELASDAVTALWKNGVAERIEVQPFSVEEVADVLAAVLGGPVEGATVRRFWGRTHGNVLFLRELVLAAVEAEVLRNEAGLWRLHDTVRMSVRLIELIESRLAGLEPPDRQAMECLALAEPIGVEVIEQAAPQVSLDRLEHRGLVRIEETGRRLDLRLAHPIYGDVLRARLSPRRSRSLNRSLADSVEAIGARRSEDTLRVAAWRLESGGPADPAMALRAADQARTRHDLVLAERLARHAVETGAGFDAELLLGDALRLQGRCEEAEEVLSGAEPDDDGRRTLLSLTRADNLAYGLGRLDDALQLLADVPATNAQPERLRDVQAHLAHLLLLKGRIPQAVELLEHVLEQSTRASTWTYLTVGFSYALMGRLNDAAAAAEKGVSSHLQLVESPGVWSLGIQVVIRSCALAWAGRLTEAEQAAQEAYEHWVAAGSTEGQAWAAHAMCEVVRGQGRVDSTVRWGMEAVSALRTLGRPFHLQFLLARLAHGLALGGQVEEAQGALEEIQAIGVSFPGAEAAVLQAQAWVDLASGRIQDARALLERSAAKARECGEHVLEAESLHDLSRIGSARGVVDRLTALAQDIDGELARARAEHVMGIAQGDAAALERSSLEFERMGAMLLAAEAAVDAAVAWRRAGEPRKATAADRRGSILSARCEGVRTRALGTSTEARVMLTARELEIARLAAQGLSNREIAARLFLSFRTVENKLHRAYEKLGLEGRSQLGEALGLE